MSTLIYPKKCDGVLYFCCIADLALFLRTVLRNLEEYGSFLPYSAKVCVYSAAWCRYTLCS